MVLEQVFKSTWKVQLLRRTPLGHLSDSFCGWLLQKGFRHRSICNHLNNISCINEYFSKRRTRPITVISEQDIKDFFVQYPLYYEGNKSIEAHLREMSYSVNRFREFLIEEGLFTPPVSTSRYEPLLNAYLLWMQTQQAASEGTLKVRRHYLCQFFNWFERQTMVQDISCLNAEIIENYVLHYFPTMGCDARRSMQATLRTFLRFCFQQGMLHCRLDYAVPHLRQYNFSKVPQGLSDVHAQKILESVDRSTPVGLRDYALIQLLYTYGVRGGQIRALRLVDINWNEDTLYFRAMKNGKDSVLPLTVDVGRSLLDYMQHGRPQVNFPEVFITARAPYHPLNCSPTLSGIVHRHARNAGISIQRCGTHAFRHCFATRMVAKGHSIKHVADMLGHRKLSTTFNYTKVDFNSLKNVALDWPGEVTV